ncbi:MAG TPA: CDP-alcohol phosphatidyltransferase family protein [Chloroflexota bacterium]
MTRTRAATPAPGVPKSNQLIDETFIYAACERLLPLIPQGVMPNHVTLAGFSLSVLAAAAYGLSGLNRSWLAVGIVAHLLFWVCDNLDGTLARRRGLTSVQGFFLDLTLDQVAYVLIYLGLGLSGTVLLPLAAGAAVTHLLHVHLIDMWIYLRGEEHFGKFGPTELTLVITSSALVTLVWPGAGVTILARDLRWFDLVAIAVIAAGDVELVRSLVSLARQLPGPSRTSQDLGR